MSIHHYENPDRFGDGPLAYEAFWKKTAGAIRSSANPKIKIAITEWNAQSTDWRTGLYAAGLLNAMERECNIVAMGSPALFLRQVSAPAWDNAFINHDHYRWFPAPNYVVMRLYREHSAPRLARTKCFPGLNVVAGLADDRERLVLKIVNPAAQEITATISIGEGFGPKSATVFSLQADLRGRNTLDEPDRIKPVEEQPLEVSQRFRRTFPPRSVTVLELR